MSYKLTELDSGLKIITANMPGMRSVAIGTWIGVGGRYEEMPELGISHFLEHLLFKGTKTRSARDIKEAIEGVGGSFNGFTADEVTCYLVKVLKKHVDIGLEVLIDMVLNPALKQEDVDQERPVIFEEIRMYKDIPQQHVHELLAGLLWPNQALGLPLAGTFETVNKINAPELKKFLDKFYQPSNIIIAAAGPIEHEEIIKKVTEYFTGKDKAKPLVFKPAKEHHDKPGIDVFSKKTEQSHLALGFYGVKRSNEDRHALNLAHIILGANMSSRLFNEVREKRGLAYHVSTSVKCYQDTGDFVVSAGCDPKKLIQCSQIILDEVFKVTKELVTEDEIHRAKEYYTGQLSMALEKTSDYMLWLGEQMLTMKKIEELEAILEKVNKVTRPEIQGICAKLFKRNSLRAALISEIDDKARKEFTKVIEG